MVERLQPWRWQISLRLPPKPVKVKVADCAPGYAKMTATAEWFVQDDLPTVYYISVSDENGNLEIFGMDLQELETIGTSSLFWLCFVCAK